MKQTFNVAGIGELLWDLLPDGKHLGGAPPNFIFHASQFGCTSTIISALGQDPRGDELKARLQQVGMDTAYIQMNDYPTGTVDVCVDLQGVPTYTIHYPAAWDFIAWSDTLADLAPRLDAVCFGTLGQRSPVSAKTIQTLLHHLKPACLRVFDINLRQHFYDEATVRTSLSQADILKLNEDELPVVARYYGLTGTTDRQLQMLLELENLQYVILTEGDRGSRIMSRTAYSRRPATQVSVVDTVGAGDSFTAAFVVGVLRKEPLGVIHRRATEVAAYTCTQAGGTPHLPTSVL